MTFLTELILRNRGLDGLDAYRAFDDPSHPALAHVDEAAGLLYDACTKHRKVLVVPDFDCDGIMSGVVLKAGLSELGFDVELAFQQPSEGYGISREFARRLMAEHPGTGLVVTSDTGANENGGIEEFRRCGADVLVTDHHVEETPRCAANVIVDPCALDSDYPNRSICGAYVAWRVLARYTEVCYRDHPWVCDEIARLRLFAAIGTVSDSMRLVGENRQLVRDGLGMARYLAAKESAPYVGSSREYTAAFSAMRILLHELDAKKKLYSGVNEETFGFQIAPIVNSIKRMSKSTEMIYDFFFGDDQLEEARELIELNDERKDLVTGIMEDIETSPQPLAPYVYVSSLENIGGVAGLVATKFLERSGVPTLVLEEHKGGSFSGSGRSPDGIDARSIVNSVGGSAHGHDQAFGCRVADRQTLELVKGAFENASRGIVRKAPLETVDFCIGRDVDYDPDLLKDFVAETDMLRPFGSGFPKPRVGIIVGPDWRVSAMNSRSGKRHLKCVAPCGIEVLVWNEGDRADDVQKNGVTVIGDLAINKWNYQDTLQLTGDIC